MQLNNLNNLNNKIKSEKETRKSLMKWAKHWGCDKDLLLLFNKWDLMMQKCNNPLERQAIGIAGSQEILKFMQLQQDLYINGQKI